MNKKLNTTLALFAIVFAGIITSCNKNLDEKSGETHELNQQITQVKSFFENLNKKKKTRASETVKLTNDSLVYYIESMLNIELDDYHYAATTITTDIVRVDIERNGEEYSLENIGNAFNTIKNHIQHKYDLLNDGTYNNIVIQYVDVKLIEASNSVITIQAAGVVAYLDTAPDPPPGSDSYLYRFWPHWYNIAPDYTKGYTFNPNAGNRISDLDNTVPGYMTTESKIKYLNYLFPNGIPTLQPGMIVLNLQPNGLTPENIGNNPYRPNMPYNLFNGIVDYVGMTKPEMNYYMNLTNPRISNKVAFLNKDYIDHYWTHWAIPFANPQNPVPSDYTGSRNDFVWIIVGNLVQYTPQ